MVRESPGPRASLRSSRPLLGSVFWTARGAGRPRDPAVSGFRPYCRTWQPRTVGLQASRLHALACLGERAAQEAGDGGWSSLSGHRRLLRVRSRCLWKSDANSPCKCP